MSAPFSTTPGAWSPPIASRAIVTLALTARVSCAAGWSSGRGRWLRHHLAAIVIPTGLAQVMRALQLAAIRAFDIRRRTQRMMRAAHSAPRGGDLLLRYGHDLLVKSGAGKKSGAGESGT